MATFTRCNDWLDYLVEDVDAASDQFVVALSNTAPGDETSNPTGDGNGVLANVTQIAYDNLSTRNITTTSSSQTSGKYYLKLTDLVLTASGDVATFRYVYIYDDTVANKPLVCVYDKGEAITLHDGDTFTLDFDATNGLFNIAPSA